MRLLVNGEAVEQQGPLTLQQLVDALRPGGGRVATLVNDAVVPAAARASRLLADGDRIELLTFAGGG